jgi:alanyl-tRNA synthetase
MNIRNEFLEFFTSKQHNIIKSAPLVPDDATLLFTNAGMVQFKDIFTGVIPVPDIPRAVSCQLCIRAGGKHNDLENVGYTARHHTLFEMLGNFSFGDYFKEEAIAYAWEFITQNLKLPIEKLWVTIHTTDDEAYEIWSKHISPNRIMRFGDKDNFWSMGDTGACGPSSEIFYDQGDQRFNSSEDKMGGEGDRFLEIWNLVFMQYDKDSKGNLSPLPKPSIDTGMGLERIIAIKEGVYNNFDSSTFKPIIEKIEEICDTKLTDKNIASFRVIADHVRTVTFMLSQGILFDKVGRGYVARRILRRAVRHGYLLGFRKAFMSKIIDQLCNTMSQFYPELHEKKDFIQEQVLLEENRFFKTIASGMELFNTELENTQTIFSGEVAFKLYDTHGFPLDLTEDMLREKELKVDNNTFDKCMNAQKAKAKSAWKGSGDSSHAGDFKILLDKFGMNEFVGYDTTEKDTRVLALLDENFKEVKQLSSLESGWVMLENTPFYPTSGGQMGDYGIINDDSGNEIGKAFGTKKFFGLNLSEVHLGNSTNLHVNDSIKAIVTDREETAKHHSATHLLQSALRKVLGDTVSQAGSLNDDKRLRFDFTYPQAMTNEEIDEVERLVNDMIASGLHGSVEELPIEEAKNKGAIAMFGEKYGDTVRVVAFGDASIELCGGTHVKNTSQIGSFYITKEGGVSAGVRRIEAVVGKQAVTLMNLQREKVKHLENVLQTKDILEGVAKLKEKIKKLKIELKDAHENVATPLEEIEINGVKVIVAIIENGDMKKIIDDMKNGHENVAILLMQVKNDKVMLVAGVKNAEAKAGDWIKEIAPIVGGGGGGRADFAQAGGKDTSKIQEAKMKALEYIKKKLNP